VLVVEAAVGIVGQRDPVALAAPAPSHLTCVAVDLGDLVQMPAGSSGGARSDKSSVIRPNEISIERWSPADREIGWSLAALGHVELMGRAANRCSLGASPAATISAASQNPDGQQRISRLSQVVAAGRDACMLSQVCVGPHGQRKPGRQAQATWQQPEP
jgi:hypothetical protein